MARVCGPVLGFRGEVDGCWRIVVLTVYDGDGQPGDLTHSAGGTGSAISPIALAEAAGMRFFAHAIEAPVGDLDTRIDYGFAGEDHRWSFTVPGRTQPPRIAYGSCNGFSDVADMKRIADKNAMWSQLVATHDRLPFHLLLLGGDQIYADQIWDVVEELRGFDDLPRQQRAVQTPSPGLHDAVLRFYARTYCQRFAQSEVAAALASIPSVMMWDDHETFDGWGSYSDEEQGSPVFRTVFAAARACFALFQLQSDPASPSWPALPGAGGFDALLRIRDIGLLVLDLRSERSQRQVISPETWNIIFDAIDGSRGLRHLLVMSSIPLVHPDMSFLEEALGYVPGMQENEDDLHDQWSSYLHRLERLRLAHRLLDFAAAAGTRVTILSGDVHVAALGTLESTRRVIGWQHCNVITQLTSSGIVHPPPPRLMRYFLERISDTVQEVDRDISARMLQFPGTNFRFVASRNWLSLEFDDRGRIWANWHVEGRPDPLTKVIHPCEPEPGPPPLSR
ncbi:MAG: alkaline phosphatase D family protein [Rhodospirillales bacterium]